MSNIHCLLSWKINKRPVLILYSTTDVVLARIPIKRDVPTQNCEGTVISDGECARFEIHNYYEKSSYIIHGTMGSSSFNDIRMSHAYLKRGSSVIFEDLQLVSA